MLTICIGRKVSVVVIDGVANGHPCCAEANCKFPLQSNRHRFCQVHSNLNQVCAIIGCSFPVASGGKTCNLPEHAAIETVHNDRSTARFQLKERQQHAKVVHPQDALPNEANNISNLVPNANFEEIFEFNRKGQPIPTTGSSTAGTTKSLRAQFGRKRTHNEQLFVAPCGVIIARETFYHAEAIYSVIVSSECFVFDNYLNPLV